MKIIFKKSGGHCGRKALTLLEVLVVIVVIGLLFALIVPALMKANQMSMRVQCASTLKQVGLAFRIWEGDNSDHFPMSVLTNLTGAPLYADSTSMFRYFQIMSNELSNPMVLVCPADKRRPATNFTTDFDSTRISYFANLDADEKYPQAFLAGDRNLTTNGIPLFGGVAIISTNIPLGWTSEIHRNEGNVSRADGSIRQFFGAALNMAWQQSGRATNRLLLPDSTGK